jgi:hypothetical protein
MERCNYWVAEAMIDGEHAAGLEEFAVSHNPNEPCNRCSVCTEVLEDDFEEPEPDCHFGWQ